jgi:hypothetical protein
MLVADSHSGIEEILENSDRCASRQGDAGHLEAPLAEG